jgi:hypothetical protein
MTLLRGTTERGLEPLLGMTPEQELGESDDEEGGEDDEDDNESEEGEPPTKAGLRIMHLPSGTHHSPLHHASPVHLHHIIHDNCTTTSSTTTTSEASLDESHDKT